MRFNDKLTCIDFIGADSLPRLWTNSERTFSPAQKQEFLETLRRNWHMTSNLFKGHVRYMSRPFIEAYKSRIREIEKALNQEKLGRVTGTLVYSTPGDGNTKGPVVKTMFYSLDDGDQPMHMIIEFVRNKDFQGVTLLSQFLCNTPDYANIIIDFMSDDYHQMGKDDPAEAVREVYSILRFLKFCEIETKILKPKEKYQDPQKERYFNETKCPIEIVDSNWFTTIIRTERFGVRGHFRLQPYTTGKKLIWIAPFEKHGYTRKARVDSQRDNI